MLRTSRRGSVLWDKVPPLTTRSRILSSSKPSQPPGYGRAFEGSLTEVVTPCAYHAAIYEPQFHKPSRLRGAMAEQYPTPTVLAQGVFWVKTL